MDQQTSEPNALPLTVTAGSAEQNETKPRKKPSRRPKTRTNTERIKRINDRHNRELADEGRKQEREFNKATKVIAQHTISWLMDMDADQRIDFLSQIEPYATQAELRLLENCGLFDEDEG